MTTQARIDANRQNAKKSTGPRTSKGKGRAARNATKHGLLAKSQTLWGEDPAAYELLVIETIEQYGAKTQPEVMLAEDIADDLFWLRRCNRTKVQLIRYRGIGEQTARDVRLLNVIGNTRLPEKNGQNEVASSSDTAPSAAEQKSETLIGHLMRSTKEQFSARFLYLSGSEDKLADDIVEVMDELEKLGRYETARLKSLEKREQLLISMITRRQDKKEELAAD